jgi:hypothetical protein
MADYQIVYLDSEGDDYNIDGCENPYLSVLISKNGWHKPAKLTIRFGEPQFPETVIEAEHPLSMAEMIAAVTLIDAESNKLVESGGSEFYSGVFYDEETDDFTRTLTFSL